MGHAILAFGGRTRFMVSNKDEHMGFSGWCVRPCWSQDKYWACLVDGNEPYRESSGLPAKRHALHFRKFGLPTARFH